MTLRADFNQAGIGQFLQMMRDRCLCDRKPLYDPSAFQNAYSLEACCQERPGSADAGFLIRARAVNHDVFVSRNVLQGWHGEPCLQSSRSDVDCSCDFGIGADEIVRCADVDDEYRIVSVE